MSTSFISTSLHVCEGTDTNFEIASVLASAGYTAHGPLSITSFLARLPDGTAPRVNTGAFGMVDADTMYVHTSALEANFNGSFTTLEVVFDNGDGNKVSLNLQVIVDPVNDAPTGTDKTFDLSDGNAVVLNQADFGFNDAVEHNGFASVVLASLPPAGQVLRAGVALAVGDEFTVAELAAGAIVFQPSQTVSGAFDVGFQVRDDGGLVGCGAADLSLAPNYLHFNVPMAHLGDFVWEDSNGNGVQDAGEAGIANVAVALLDAGGSTVASTTTDASGLYSFTVTPGTYAIALTLPAGFVATVQDRGGDDTADSDIGISGTSGNVTVLPGATNNTLDAGLVRLAELGDHVWRDNNKNGMQDSGEAGVAGVLVRLLDSAGNPTGASATTDADGNYLFRDLKPGSYSVQFDKTTLPAGYVFTSANAGADAAADSDASITDGTTAAVTLASGASNHTLDAGIVALPATLGDTVWEDGNANGVQDAGEAGIANVTVQLRSDSGVLLSSTTTDSAGKYVFSVDPGTYSVALVAPSGFVATDKDAGANDAADSDIGAGFATSNFTVAAGETNKTIDAGLYALAQLGDRVWIDCNRNGVQDSGDKGLSGVRVTLLDAGGNAVGSPVLSDANGNYLFKDLKPGNYSVQFDKATLPASYIFTTRDAGSNDAIDSDVDAAGKSGTITLSSGQVNKTVDAGVLQGATIGDRVWHDKNANGIQDSGESGIAGATVQLKDSGGTVISTVNTDADGYYKFDVAPATYSVHVNTPGGYLITARDAGSDNAKDSDINSSGNTGTITVAAGDVNKTLDAGFYKKAAVGDHVWLDSNGNGVQDSGEAGMSGVTVKLYTAGGTLVNSALTNGSGDYTFTDLMPGNYVVKFVAPSGYAFTGKDVGSNNSADSDAGTTDGKTAQFSLASGQTDLTWDAGLVKYGSIGNLVWEDKNYNGLQDAGEAGVKNVSVKLLDANNAVLATTTTDASGNYLFGNLKAGSYKVQVDKPASYYFTKADIGSNGAVDSDVGATGRTGTIALAAGQNDLNWDAGIYRKASVGDLVWRDSDHDGIQDSGEEGIGGITVQLYTESGVLVETRKTDANGKYKFADVDPGKYYLKFDKANVSFTDDSHKSYNMNIWKWGMKNVGSNDLVDSDVTGNGADLTNVTRTDVFTLTSGMNDMSRDAAITPLVIDLNGDGIHTIARADFGGRFDLLGNGSSIHSGWIAADDGFLAIDMNGNGSIDGIGELFGGQNTGDGFARLATFDTNGDGQVNAQDAHFAGLGIWRDANSNGVTDAGELMSLNDAGVASLAVGYVALPFVDANHNLHLERSSATLGNGATVDMTDIYLNVDADEAAAAGATLASVATLAGDAAAAQLIGCAPLLGAL